MTSKNVLGSLLNKVGDLLAMFEVLFSLFWYNIKYKIGVTYMVAEGLICHNTRNIFTKNI